MTPMPQPRTIGPINWIGVRTLYWKEVQRFWKVIIQTVLAPVVTTLLMLAVFALALGRAVQQIGDLPFTVFLGSGLIAMAMAQNAFANTSSSLMTSKVQGNIVDLLMPPLGPGEVLFAFAAGGVTRGLVVGLTTGLAMLPFVPLGLHNAGVLFYFAVASSLMLALLGVLAGLWAEKFDHMAAVTNFVITPLAFLSGTFYSVELLPSPWYEVSHANPLFFMIDGLRYGLTGHADSSIVLGAAVLASVDIVLWLFCLYLLRRGYRLKA